MSHKSADANENMPGRCFNWDGIRIGIQGSRRRVIHSHIELHCGSVGVTWFIHKHGGFGRVQEKLLYGRNGTAIKV